jgi:Flp pilus assembly protein TadG
MKRLAHSTDGAAYVEFIIALFPMMLLFFGMMQLNGLLLADLVARHAAVHAVRAAIVCDSQAGAAEDASQLASKGGCAWEAANQTLAAIKSFGAPDFSLTIDGASPHGNALVTATVRASYHCHVPLAGPLLCGLVGDSITKQLEGGGVLVLTRKASLPNQGANYQ